MEHKYILAISDGNQGWDMTLDLYSKKMSKREVASKIYWTLENILGFHRTMEEFYHECDRLIESGRNGIVLWDFPDEQYPDANMSWSFRSRCD